ncbi:MAG: ABC transporter permease [Ardenticatenales bacterium]|nr:ABC transporter permease [Ardenticatenales bacterium]
MATTTNATENKVRVTSSEGIIKELTGLERWVGPEWYRLIKGVFTNPLSILGLVIILIFLLVAIFAPVLAPAPSEQWDPSLIPRDGFKAEPQPPGTVWNRNVPEQVPAWYRLITGNEEWVHILGTTSGQYDIWYGLIWGSRTALIYGTLVVLADAIIGITIGSLAGFYGGWTDEVLMRVVEVFIAFPFLVGALILSSMLVPIFGRSIWPASIALIVFGWTRYARLLRGDILATKERDYVLASRASGARSIHLILRHVLPNAIFPTLVYLSLDMGAIVLSFATLSFLGVGVQIGYADWGQIVSQAREWILALDQYWYIIVYPGLALLLYGLGWNLVGDALRDILDPKLRGVR